MRTLASLIVIVAIVAAAYYFYTKKKEDEAIKDDGIFSRGTQKTVAAKPIQDKFDVANLAVMLHNTMSRPFYQEWGVLGAVLSTPAGILGTPASLIANSKDFTNADSWNALLAQTDKNIIAVNNYFNARYKAEKKGNLYKWINDERELPFTNAYEARKKLQEKMIRLGLT